VSGEGLEVRVGLELCHFVPGVVGRSSWAGPPGDAVRPTDMGRAWALGSGGSGAPEWVGVLRWMLLPVYGGLRGQVRRQLRSMFCFSKIEGGYDIESFKQDLERAQDSEIAGLHFPLYSFHD